MGADIIMENRRTVGGEPVADLLVKSAPLRGTVIDGRMMPKLIDEVPVLAVAMAAADGESGSRMPGNCE